MEPNALLFANCHSCKHQSPVVLVCDRCPLSFCEFHLRTWFHFTPNDNGVWPCPRCYGRCDCNKCLAYYATYGVLEDDHLEVEDDDDDDDDASDEEDDDEDNDDHEHVDVVAETNSHQEEEEEEDDDDDDGAPEEEEEDDDEDNDDHEHVDVVAETNSHQEEEEEEDDDDDDGAPEEEEETHLTCGPGDDGDGDDGDSRDDAKVLELQQVIDLERQFAVKYTALEATCSSQMDRIYRLEEDLAAVNQKFSVVTQNLQMANLTLEKKIQRFNDYKEKLREKDTQLLDAEKLRKKLHNTILELKGNIRVYVRVRPLLPDDGPGARITYPTSAGLAGRGITLTQSGVEHPFAFDQVFNDTASQQDVFKEISELIQSSVDGYRVCIFSYGQTGSGKSHTMMGRPESPFEKGLIPRSIEQVFITTEALVSQGWKYKLEASLLEIYNENIRDLLAIKRNVKQPEYKISHLEGNTHVSNLTVVSVDSYEKVSFLIQEAVQYRSVASTDMNQQSSRSHFVFTLRINGVNERTGKGLHGVLNLIDLAGSERLSRSGATGARLLETQYINTSLSALTDVILALTRKESHIPVRNSKLTYLLQNSLSSKSKALMFVNLSPALSSISESLCSLRFAARANQCQL